MPSSIHRFTELQRIWIGLAALLVCFVVSMTGLNAWQLTRYGVPVSGGRSAREPVLEQVLVLKCWHDPMTMLQTYRCTVRRGTRATGTREVGIVSVHELSGMITVEVHEGRSGPVLVPEGTNATRRDWLPVDVGLVVWVILLMLLPVVLALINAVHRVRAEAVHPGSLFDSLAAEWDANPARIARAELAAAAIRQRLPVGGTWLDFGAGTGLLGLALLDHADHMVLADTSSGMLAEAERKIGELPDPTRASVLSRDIMSGPSGPADYQAVVSLLVLHHVPDLVAGLARLAALVVPGGWLALSDLDSESGSYHAGSMASPAHNGIDRGWLRTQLLALGLTDVEVDTVGSISRNGHDYTFFLAVAHKPAG